MTKFLNFFNAYPFLWPMFVISTWYVFSGLALLFLDRWIPATDEQWTLLYEQRPKVAALAKLLKSWGWALPSGARALRAFLSGPPPTLARPKTLDDVASLKAIAAAQIEARLKGLPAPTLAEKAAISTRTPPQGSP